MQISPPTQIAQSAPLTSDVGLFRSEVVEQQQAHWLGTVLLAPRLSHTAVSACAVLAAAGVLSLLFLGEYTQKVRVNGWLMPDVGLVRVFAPQAGVLAQLHVREGMEVKKGAALAVLSTEVRSEALGATRSEAVRRLQNRRDSLAIERTRQEALHAHQAEGLSKRLAVVDDTQANLEQQVTFQRARLDLAEQGSQRQRYLYSSRITSVDRVQQAEEGKLQQALNVQLLERERVTLARERLGLEIELREAPLRNQMQLAELDRNIATLEQEIAEAEARREVVITAPQDGVVTAIQAEAGGGASATVPLLTIVPSGATLQAHLFGPSRAIGFVRPGQRVMLRYEAFSYQKFGQYEGSVTSISRSAISPSELSQQLSGLTSFFGGSAPVYQITVNLTAQAATAYGQAVPLQAGMQVEADVLTEKRRLVEWVLEPLFSLTGKWQR